MTVADRRELGYRQHGRRHRPGGSDEIPELKPNIQLLQSMNGVTIDHTSVDTQKISFDTVLAPPINNGGTVDTDVYDITGGGPWDTIPILQPGLYWAEARCDWWLDWGKFRINLQFEHSNGESFPISDFYGLASGLATEWGGVYPGLGGFPHDQTVVTRRGFILIDEFTFTSSGTIDIFTTITNSSGVDRTPNNTDNVVDASLSIVQLSKNCHASVTSDSGIS